MWVWILVCAGGLGAADGCDPPGPCAGTEARVLWGNAGATAISPTQYLVFITVISTQWALSVWKLMVFSVLEIYFRIYVFKNSLHVLPFNIWSTSWTFPNVCFNSAVGCHPLRDINCLGCWRGGGRLYIKIVEGTGLTVSWLTLKHGGKPRENTLTKSTAVFPQTSLGNRLGLAVASWTYVVIISKMIHLRLKGWLSR